MASRKGWKIVSHDDRVSRSFDNGGVERSYRRGGRAIGRASEDRTLREVQKKSGANNQFREPIQALCIIWPLQKILRPVCRTLKSQRIPFPQGARRNERLAQTAKAWSASPLGRC
jgi:hypothetical protein